MKYILFIGDGMADNPVPELGGKTPLEYADIPNIDKLAGKGVVGSVKTVPPGLPAGSDTAILSILGCDISKSYSGRAPLEAAASNIFLDPGNVAYRCNLVCIEDGDMPYEKRKMLSHSAGSIEGEDALGLMDALFADKRFSEAMKKAQMIIHTSPNFRQTAVQKTADIEGIRLAPPHNYIGTEVGEILPSGCENAEILKKLMKISFEVMDKHPINERRRSEGKMPANSIWLWAEGTAVSLQNFYETYGKRGAVVSAVPLVQGIAKLIGLDVYEVEGATGELDTNLEGKVETAAKLVHDYDFVVLHVEAPDECTHNGDLKGKLQAINWLDSRVLVPLMAKLDAAGEDYRILFLSDHKTLTETRGHDGDPVPYLLYDSTKNMNNEPVFNEKQGAAGPFIEKGIMLMDTLFGN